MDEPMLQAEYSTRHRAPSRRLVNLAAVTVSALALVGVVAVVWSGAASSPDSSLRAEPTATLTTVVENVEGEATVNYSLRPDGVPVTLHPASTIEEQLRLPGDSFPFKSFSDAFVQHALQTGVNWIEQGAVTPAKDQGGHPYCGTFGRVAAAEGQWARSGHPLASFSEEELVDCIGWDKDQFSYFSTHGFMKTEDYPYKTDGPSSDPPIPGSPCQYDKSKIIPGTDTAFTGATGGAPNEAQLAAFVFKNGPVQTGINANVFGLRTKGCEATKDCFITPQMCSDPSVKDQPINHSITLVGFGTDPHHGDYWIVKNSWSQAFANDGFIKVARGVSCGHIDCCGNVFTIGDPAAYFEE